MKELRETLKQIGLHYVEEYVYLAHAITLRKLNKTTNIFRRANELLRRGVQKGSEPWKRCFGNQPKRSHKKRSDLKKNKCWWWCEGSYRTKEQMGWPSCKTELICMGQKTLPNRWHPKNSGDKLVSVSPGWRRTWKKPFRRRIGHSEVRWSGIGKTTRKQLYITVETIYQTIKKHSDVL